jgi:chromosomal replication initiator protein
MKEWNHFLDELEKKLGTEIVQKWLRSLKVVTFDACNLYLEAQDSFQIIWFEEHIRNLVKNEFRNSNHHPILPIAARSISLLTL